MIIGPIAYGETPEQAVLRLSKLFGKEVLEYSYVLHDKPVVGAEDEQQFPVIIGTVRISVKEEEII